jgi:hypothetical protein
VSDQPPLHDVPGFGQLGQSPDEFERRRIAGLSSQVPATAHPAVIERDRTITVAEQQRRTEMTEALKPLVGEAFGALTKFLGDLQLDIRAQTELMRTLDAPVEAVVASHERASESFETLRSDISEIARETPTALRDLARVMDTAGLNDAQSRAEKRFEILAREIHDSVRTLIDAQATAFKGIAADMVKILHLLERLQARELREAKHRAEAKA